MRIVSLLPSITEIICALGLGDHLVGITHECDYPPSLAGIPVVTSSALDHSNATSAEIDSIVSAQLRDDISIYHLNMDVLAAAQPDLVLTQALCDVCAVSFSTVRRAVRELGGGQRFGGEPQVLSLEPMTLEDILGTILTVGAVTGREGAAAELVGWLRARIERVRARLGGVARRRVALLEWLDPPYSPGHWLPELVDLAGGRSRLGTAGRPSQRISWGDVIAFAPEVIVLTPCGFTLERTVAEAEAILPRRTGWHALPAVRAGRVYAVDGNSYFSRPGPRIVDSLELLAELVHPELCAGWGPAGAARQVCASDAGER